MLRLFLRLDLIYNLIVKSEIKIFRLLVQNSADVGEAGVEEVASAVGTCKRSLNQSWGCSGKTLRCSSQYSVSTEIECSNENFSRVSRSNPETLDLVPTIGIRA